MIELSPNSELNFSCTFPVTVAVASIDSADLTCVSPAFQSIGVARSTEKTARAVLKMDTYSKSTMAEFGLDPIRRFSQA